MSNLSKKIICNPILNEDTTMFSNKTGDPINLNLKTSNIYEDIVSLEEIDINDENNLYAFDNKLLLNNSDNYFYKIIDKEKNSNIKKIKFDNNPEIFYIDDKIIIDKINNTEIKNMITNIDDKFEDISSLSFNYDNTLIAGSDNNSYLDTSLVYNNSNNKKDMIILSIKIKKNLKIDDYIYQLRVNGIPTKYFSIIVGSNNYLLIEFFYSYFTKDTNINEFNQFDFIIKDPNNNEIAYFTNSKFNSYIRPFISYDPMTKTTDDITINCRYDISTITTNQTKDIILNIDNPDLLEYYDNVKRPLIDNTLLFIMNDTTINLNSKNIKARFTINVLDKGSNNDYYLISKNDVFFEKENYKVYNNRDTYKNTNSILLTNSNNIDNNISIVVENIKNITIKKKDTMIIKFMKLNESGINKINNNIFDMKSEDIQCYIIVKINVVINPVAKYEPSEDELEIMKNIFSFNTDIISTTFGSNESFSISANDNIILNEPKEGEENLNSDLLKEKFHNGELDINKINDEFDNFDITCYGVYIDHMIIDKDDIGGIRFHRLHDIKSDDLVVSNESTDIIQVCNVYDENNKESDKCNDGFNELAFEYILEDNSINKIIIVPDSVFKLFNFTNGILSINSEEHDLSKYLFYPTASFTFDSIDYTDIEEFKTSNLYIDYKPVKYRITKKIDNDNTVWTWTLYAGEDINILKNEKIIKLISKPKEEQEDVNLSEVEGTDGNIYDTDSIITYPEFVNFKINMETENGNPLSIDGLTYEGKIINNSDMPILIEDISLNNFMKDSKLFKLNDKGEIDNESSFMNYELSVNKNSIKTDLLKISKFINKEDITIIEGNLFIIKPYGSINVKIYNSEDITNIPENFGKTLNKINDSLHYNLYYLNELEDKTYSFRENYSTTATNLETRIEVIPSISNLNFDTEYIRYGDTVYNIINDIIEQKSVVFRLITKDNENKYSNEESYENYIDNCIINNLKDDDDLNYLLYNITTLDLEDIYFLESGKDFSYVEILKKLINNYIDKNPMTDKQYTEFLNNIIGIQVITRTLFKNTAKSYDMITITNYIDLLLNTDNYKPKLNRLTGSIYHLIKIENKHEDLYEYKIIVDDKEYNEYDIITNDNSNEIALHKFRLYFRFKNNNSKDSSEWLLADSFEGCIDGTKPIVPNLLVSETITDNGESKYKNLHKYSTLTREEIKEIIKNPDNFLNEINYYEGNVSILGEISYDMKFSETKSSNLITVKAPNRDEEESILYFTASDKTKGLFEIENISVEPVNIQINEISEDESYKELYTITTNLLDSHITKVDNYNPLYRLEPGMTMNVYVQFNKYIPNFSIKFNIRAENNYNKNYSSQNIKWDSYQIKLVSLEKYNINSDIIKNILPYSFYDDSKNISEYYDFDPSEIFNVIDVNNFNRNSLYTSLLYLDNKLIYNSNIISDKDSTHKLLVDEKILDRLLYIGNHTITLITNKFNGLLNYQNYFLTIIDHNVYNKNISKNYFENFKNNKNEFFNTYIDHKYTRNSLILRNPKNEGYNSIEFENELFIDNNGDLSIVTKDVSNEKDYYLYRFSEIMKHYMNLSEFLVDSNQYLFEKNYQEVLLYYNKTKDNYNILYNKIISKINKDYGEIYKIIDNINYRFEVYDDILEEIKILENEKENNSKNNSSINIDYLNEEEFVNRLFTEDSILSKYKEFNFLFNDKNELDNFKINITNILENKLINYIYSENKGEINVNLYTLPFNSFNNEKITLTNSIDETIYVIDNNNIELNLNNIYNKCKDKYSSFRLFVNIKINTSTKSKFYTYKLNMYNLKDSLLINNEKEIRISPNKEIDIKTLTNITDIPIIFSVKGKKEFEDIYSFLNIEDPNSTFNVFYNSVNGYFIDNERKYFLLPAHSNCDIIFKYNELIDQEFITNSRIIYLSEKNNKEEDGTPKPSCEITIPTMDILIDILNIDLNENLKYYLNYRNITINNKINGINLKLKATNFNVLYLSDLDLSNNNNHIFKEKIKSFYTNMCLVNDTDKTIFGYFDVNGLETISRSNEIITDESNNKAKVKYFDYFPNRYNTINGTYDFDYNNEENKKIELAEDNIEKECLPITFNNSLMLKPKYDNNYFYFSFSIRPLDHSNNKKSISFLLSSIDSEENIINDSFSSLTTIKTKDIITKNTMNLLDNIILDVEDFNLVIGSNGSQAPEKYIYNTYSKCLNNKIEYILSKYKNKKINSSNITNYGIKYIYFEELDNEKINIVNKVRPNDEVSNDLDKKIDELFSYKLLASDIYDAFDKDNTSSSNTYKSIINKVDAFNISDMSLLINSIRDIKSDFRTLDYNIKIQKNLLENKASVKEFKEWVNKNVFTLSNFEYAINELFTDFYVLSDKGANIAIYDKLNNELKKYNFCDAYPIININKSFGGYKFLDLNVEDENKIFYDGYSKWKSEYYFEKEDNTFEVIYNKGNYFLEKLWININDENIKPIYYKKNFTDYSNFLENYNNSQSTIGLQNSLFKFGCKD